MGANPQQTHLARMYVSSVDKVKYKPVYRKTLVAASRVSAGVRENKRPKCRLPRDKGRPALTRWPSLGFCPRDALHFSTFCRFWVTSGGRWVLSSKINVVQSLNWFCQVSASFRTLNFAEDVDNEADFQRHEWKMKI
ncbi:Hypothetical_protein [Hexamita inflata]|uniref:Hypothetical_protein n=1 Tax=Hexamita inflata TaxID=28002 RepID=A0AA86TPK1_9EUKA|nr:Hypothetical protein HINF_LOCUS11566 [Hexamita inflata]